MPMAETAAALLSKQRFGFRTRQVESIVPVGIVPAVLVNNNPDRVFLQLILEGAFDVRIGRNGSVSSASGIPLSAPNGITTFTPERDGEATGYERWAVANGGVSNVRVIETVRLGFTE